MAAPLLHPFPFQDSTISPDHLKACHPRQREDTARRLRARGWLYATQPPLQPRLPPDPAAHSRGAGLPRGRVLPGQLWEERPLGWRQTAIPPWSGSIPSRWWRTSSPPRCPSQRPSAAGPAREQPCPSYRPSGKHTVLLNYVSCRFVFNVVMKLLFFLFTETFFTLGFRVLSWYCPSDPTINMMSSSPPRTAYLTLWHGRPFLMNAF